MVSLEDLERAINIVTSSCEGKYEYIAKQNVFLLKLKRINKGKTACTKKKLFAEL